MPPKDWIEQNKAVEAAKAEILAALDIGVTAKAVKSVQRGLINAGTMASGADRFKYNTSNEYSRYIDITISAVNPAKSSAKIYHSGAGTAIEMMVPILISETTLRVYLTYASNASDIKAMTRGLSWEVIEFN